MKAGDIITCPGCGERTVVKLKKDISGWQMSAGTPVCALCGKELESEETAVPKAVSARDKLAALLGGEVETVAIDPGEEYRKGCRNCAHLLEHPFKLLCAQTQKEVDPMDSCPLFLDRKGE
ncbi:MAG: hypothetical protein IKC65_03895 [Lentisphaeria bacterium]|nr:hypothetical protein [Lentisphaeria bacterium]